MTDEPNSYGRQLTAAEIDAKVHRSFVGGMWEEMGALQLDFLRRHGAEPAHQVLDMGCGALRGGIPLIRYLEPGHYCGLDRNASLIEAGRRELAEAGLEARRPALLVNERFEARLFGRRFDYVVAQSVFTHLPMNSIVRCLVETAEVLQPDGVLFATFFEAPATAHLTPIAHEPGGIVTNYDADPYHYCLEEMRWMAARAGLDVDRLGDWGHPRGQRMLAFRREARSSATPSP